MKNRNKLAAALALLAATAAVAAEEVPFTLFKTDIVVDVRIGDRTLPFVWDTGISKNNILSAETANELGLKPEGQARFSDSAGRRGAMSLTTVDTIRVGDIVLRNQEFAVARLPANLKKRPGAAPIAGYLGPPLMQDTVACIDYRDQILRRRGRSEFDGDDLVSIPMPLNHGLQTIEVTVDGMAATLAVDTGADSGVHLFPAFGQKYDVRKRYPGLKAGRAMSGSGGNFTVLGGVDVDVGLGDNTTVEQVSLLLVPQAFDPAWGIDGFVDYDFLSRLNPCLDREGERMLWSDIE